MGRDSELERIATLLNRARLITLTGPGGIGKTRLAAEAVRLLGKLKSGGADVYWARLARLPKNSDVGALEEELAHAVIDVDFSGRSVRDALVDNLARTKSSSRTVLVLDNCEHVLSAVASLSAELLDTIPKLTILATSREPLGWVDEYRVPVPPLSRQHGLILFRQRSELTGRPISGVDDISTAAKICRHVHNHPLYIQLAAARLTHQTPGVILRGLTGHADDTRLRWSHGARVGGDPRHRGVHDVIDWSYELCTEKERLLFDRLSVFAAGYDTNPDDTTPHILDVGADLDAIESICCDEDADGTDNSIDNERCARVTLARHEVVDLLERLADHSLVSVHMGTTSVRYSLLESLRVFAQQRLLQRGSGTVGEPARLAERHMYYYRDKTIYAAAHWFRPEQQDLFEWGRAAWSNTVTAIESSLTLPGRAETGLEICLGLVLLQVPFTSGAVREARRWLQRCLDATRVLHPQPTELQIGAMAASGWLALMQGLRKDAEKLLEDCITACIADPDVRSNWQRTAESDIGLPAVVEFAWGTGLFARRDADSIGVLGRAEDKFAALGDQGSAALSGMFAVLAASLLGTAEQANEIARQFQDRTNASGTPRDKSWSALARAVALTKHGDPTEALALERDSLAYQLAIGDQWAGVWLVEFRTWSLARILTDSSRRIDRVKSIALATEIAHLVGGTAALRTKLGIKIEEMGPFFDESSRAHAVAREVLGPDAFAQAEARGSRLRLELGEVQRLALGTLSPDALRRDPSERILSSHWQQLTPAEAQVAILAAAGLTNSAIATRRGTSFRTTDAQITAILHKLAISSRGDIIECVPRHLADQIRIERDKEPSSS
ncbi:AAA family ATPase [Nocardia sp. NPDC049190]|uniref:ATP-binding protein n=1 Tax=Nocardia sp. NPDC049190 TaxID=3155650 RepID=UPI003402191E